MSLYYLALFISGLVVGSFLGMLTFRLPRRISLKGRSFCDRCKKTISWHDNIPIFYYLFSGGRCRGCGKKISVRYPVIELLTAGSFLLIGFFWQNREYIQGTATLLIDRLGVISLPFLLFLAAGFLGLAIVDYEFELLPDEILLFVGIPIFLVLLALPSPALFAHMLWGFLGMSLFLLLYLLTRGRGMGFGDVKLSFVLSGLLGYPGTLVFILLSFVLGSVAGVLLIIFGRAQFGRPISFGPFLLASGVVSLFFGVEVFSWYMGLFT